ncbi:MAG: transketolase family protein [Acidimicrobiales bacterium]|jgi:transketolase
MAEQATPTGSGTPAAAASGQALSEVFRGSAGDEHALRDARSSKGIAERTIPAFVAGAELADLAEDDERIVVLTADLANANRTADFAKRHPDRFFNMGVAEQNMVSVAAGLAAAGQIPFVATFASYLALLACEQIRTDCAYPGMPVRLLGHHSGMSLGYYGTSHHSLEDIGIMRTIADLTVVSAADANELRAILRLSLDWPGAMYIRLGRGRDPEVYPEPPAALRIGRAVRLRDGGDLTMISTGSEVRACLDAAEALANDGISVRVVDMHTIKPLDTDEILAAARETSAILSVEEHNRTGGLGSAVAETLADAGISTALLRHGVPDVHVVLGPPAGLYARYQLDADGVASKALELLSSSKGANL